MWGWYAFPEDVTITESGRCLYNENVVGTGSALRGAVICFCMSNEAMSLFENAAHIGLPNRQKDGDET